MAQISPLRVSPQRQLTPSRDPKYFKRHVIDFLRKNSDLNLSKESREFIPYAHERDTIGNLLTRKTNTELMMRTPSCPGKVKIPSKAILHIPIEEMKGREFNFNNFKYQERITNMSPKISYKKQLRQIETERESKATLSPSFKVTARKESKPDESPGVGYYQITNKLTNPSPQNIYFSREKKGKSISIRRTGQDCLDLDLMATYNKVYQKKAPVPDFTRNTDRSSHYYTKLQPGYETVKRELDALADEYANFKVKKPQLDFLKENVQETEPRWRKASVMSTRNMPLNMTSLNEKFFQMKRKYDIHFTKLK